MPEKKVSDEDVEKMKTLKKEGMTYDEIAKELGISKSTVSNYLEKESGKTKITPEIIEKMRDQMRELRDDGMTYEEIAEEMGISLMTVSNYLKRLEKSDEEELDETQIKKIKNMEEQGMSPRGISRALGLSISQVRNQMEDEHRGFFDKLKEKLGF